MPLDLYLFFIVTAVVLSATPGPIMMLALRNGMGVGMRRSLFGVLGTSLGNVLLMTLSALGLGALLYSSIVLFEIVKWLGAAYLIYLGIQLWRTAATHSDIEAPVPARTRSNRGLFLQSLFVAVSNPKGLIFFGALFPQFMVSSASPLMQFALLGLTFLTIDCVWQCIYAAGGTRMMRWLRTPRHRTWFNRVSGGAFVGAGFLLAAMKK